MNLRNLQNFLVITEEMHFTRAAERLHIAQPALSVQIRNLEAEVGVQLLTRKGRGIKLTEAGRVFLEEVRHILVHATRGLERARRAADGKIGNLSIGYNSAAEYLVLPKVVSAFMEKWPDVHLSFRKLSSVDAIEKLNRGQLDLGLVWSPGASDEFDQRELIKHSLVAVLPAKHRLASAPSISIKDLSQEPLIFFPSSMDPGSLDQVRRLFLQTGATMNVVQEIDSLMSLLNFVSFGRGCSIQPGYVRSIPKDGVVYKSLRPPNIEKSLVIIKRKGMGGLAETFFSFTVENIPKIAPEKGSKAKKHRGPAT